MPLDSSNIVLVVHLDITPGEIDRFLEIVSAHGERSRRLEPGCLGFEVLRPREQPDTVILVETYADDAALESHWGSVHVAEYREKVQGLIASRSAYRCDPA